MDIQTKKLLFLEEYLRLNNEELIEKLSALLKTEKQRLLQKKLIPMSEDELDSKLNRSQADIIEGRLHSQEEVEAYFKQRRSK